jgi:homocitrate synthase NifV
MLRDHEKGTFEAYPDEVQSSQIKGPIFIDDTTLRDGEQTAGVVFANDEKIHIAKMLDLIGVHQIEAGVPAMGGDEKDTITVIAALGLKASILGWNRAVISDVKHSLDCGVDAVALSISSSDIHIDHKLGKDRTWVLDSVRESVKFSKDHDLYVSVNAEDASRSDPDFLVEFAGVAKESGADRLRYCDTVGILDPLEVYKRIKALKEQVDIVIEMHTHNDFGMATANALAGLEAGATYVNTTVNGLGERAGNASMEELVMALRYNKKLEINIRTSLFRELSEYVALASGRSIPTWKPVVGGNLFVYESEGRASGVVRDPTTYEMFLPGEVGLPRRFSVGKYSGPTVVRRKLREQGYHPSEDEICNLVPVLRSRSIGLKRSLFDQEIIDAYTLLREGSL